MHLVTDDIIRLLSLLPTHPPQQLVHAAVPHQIRVKEVVLEVDLGLWLP